MEDRKERTLALRRPVCQERSAGQCLITAPGGTSRLPLCKLPVQSEVSEPTVPPPLIAATPSTLQQVPSYEQTLSFESFHLTVEFRREALIQLPCDRDHSVEGFAVWIC